MRFLIQVVQNAHVDVDEETIGKIDRGYVVFIGIQENDTFEIADKMIRKLNALRINMDDQGKTNLSITDVHGEMLLISQFTLYADCRSGNRPSFVRSGSYDHANEIYKYIIQKERQMNVCHIETGSFGADMKVHILNDGPFTVMLDSDELFS